MPKLRRAALITTLSLLLACVVLGALHDWVYAVPREAATAGRVYAGMPADRLHQRIALPVDHGDPARGTFSSFYLLSPGFFSRANDNVTFLLADGQMDLVGAEPDFGFFDEVLGGTPYVLMAVRGHAPTVLPQVFRDGEVDYALAMKLYGSDQQVQDIEAVRADMVRKGLLPPPGRVNVFGASGAGVLAQQYVSRYPQRVKRLILESTGARPGIAGRAAVLSGLE